MTQTIVVTLNADGSHSPAYDETWPEATQVRWAVAVAALETGLRIDVREQEEGWYSLSVKGPRTLVGNGPMSAESAYGYLDGVRAGVRASQP